MNVDGASTQQTTVAEAMPLAASAEDTRVLPSQEMQAIDTERLQTAEVPSW